jgi:hypothetical protein
MARSRQRNKRPLPAPRARKRWDWRRVFGGLADLVRNFALVAFTAPFLEPLLTGGAGIDAGRASAGIGVGLVFLWTSIILDHERSE